MNIKDQGWGNLKGAVELKLCRGQNIDPKQYSEWDPQGSGNGPHVVHRELIMNATHVEMNVERKFDAQHPFISKFRNGD